MYQVSDVHSLNFVLHLYIYREFSHSFFTTSGKAVSWIPSLLLPLSARLTCVLLWTRLSFQARMSYPTPVPQCGRCT